jgi:hypothetical protein
MSTIGFYMKSITAWSDLLTEEEGFLVPEFVERLEAAYERAKKIATALPFTYDPLWLLKGYRPEGWDNMEAALTPGRDALKQYREKLYTLSPEAALELDYLVGEQMAVLEESLVLFMRALLEARQAERPTRQGICGWLKVLMCGKAQQGGWQ